MMKVSLAEVGQDADVIPGSLGLPVVMLDPLGHEDSSSSRVQLQPSFVADVDLTFLPQPMLLQYRA